MRFVVGLGLAGLALAALNGQRGELIGASSELAHLKIGWMILGGFVEVMSFVSFAGLQRRLLQVGGVELPMGQATALTLAAGAIASSIPAGPAFASVFAFRYYRRKGANDALAGWTLLATLVCAALALGLLATAGVALASSEGASYNLVGVILAILFITVVADAVVLQRHWLATLVGHLLQASHAVFGRPRRHGVEIVEGLLARLSNERLSWKAFLATLSYGMGDWLFDCAALVCSFAAVGAPVPWRGLLLAYGAAQLAANLPITPGGLGVVEGSLTIALVAFGGAELSTVAAVLCYRIISFWGYLPIGWASWVLIGLRNRKEDRQKTAQADTLAASAEEASQAMITLASPSTPSGGSGPRGGRQ